MKRFLQTLTAILTLVIFIGGCSKESKEIGRLKYPAPVLGATPAVQWKATELTFTSTKTYDSSFYDVDVDVIFTHSNGTALKMPAFWDGGNTWKVRFAPTLIGNWKYKTVCSDTSNTGLNNKTGNITCYAYTGNLAIYKHGFIKTMPNTKYFVYDDGTPFFYLGDTHASMSSEPIDSSVVAGISSQFKYIVDKRVQQGFTVYQSEPLGTTYYLSDGLTSSDLPGFADLDRRFQYIADAGLVHANDQLVYANEFEPSVNGSKYSAAYLDKLCRYWVARYAAYPVFWSTAQEADPTFYGQYVTTNPWKDVLQSIYKYDPYKHPSSAETENVSVVAPSGFTFKYLLGYKWFALQWDPIKNDSANFTVPEYFWNNEQGMPVVLWEADFVDLWTNDYGGRVQFWVAYLNGMYGHGYGVEDIWLYNSNYDINVPSVVDGITITVADKAIKWYNSVNLPSAYQMGYGHKFFKFIEWWKLIPRFNSATWFINNGSWYSIASDSNNLYVAYFYNNINRNTGTLKNLANTRYTVQWYNPITGTYNIPTTVKITNNSYTIGEKPDNNDWVLLVKRL
jgi:hypothetical protein